MKHLHRNAAALAAALILGASAQVTVVAANGQAPATPPTPATNETAAAGHVHSAPAQGSKGAPPAKGKYMTITGEVMDPACFLEAGSKSIGPGHFQCAIDCARSGQTLAIYDRDADRIYFIAGELPGKNPNDPLMPYIHKKVDVLGTVYHRADAYGIVILKVALHEDKAGSPASGAPAGK